jgi:hypothetical protein
MCENFVCVRLVEGSYKTGSTERALPEPCYEHLNCQICELMYNCDFCASKDKCKHGSAKTLEKRKTSKDISKEDH